MITKKENMDLKTLQTKFHEIYPDKDAWFFEGAVKIGIQKIVERYSKYVQGFEEAHKYPTEQKSVEFLKNNGYEAEYSNDISSRDAIDEIIKRLSPEQTQGLRMETAPTDELLKTLILLNPNNKDLTLERISSTPGWWREYFPIGVES